MRAQVLAPRDARKKLEACRDGMEAQTVRPAQPDSR
jgi:hypothetical protein